MSNIAKVAGRRDTIDDMFFSALGGAKDQYRSAVTDLPSLQLMMQ